MRVVLAPLLLTAALGFGPAAFAADPPAPPAGAMAGNAMMGGGMMAGGMMDMGAMQCMDQSDARLVAVKAELKLTDAQLPLWNAFVEAEKANAQAMRQSMGMGMGMGMMQGGGAGQSAQTGSGMMMGSGPLPERLERHEKMMTAHMEALRKLRAAVSPLYDSLTPDQKAKADRLLCGTMAGAGGGSAAMGTAPTDHGH